MKKKYYLMKMFFLFFSLPFFAQNNPVTTIEYQALVDVYNSMGGDNWNTKWDISTNNLHTTDWYGVTIENEHVVAINLYGNNISGVLPTTFSNLKFLRSLDLNASSYPYYYYPNDLSTSDLNNLSGLESLENLNLTSCKISGTIPNSLGNLIKLKSLNLTSNSLEGPIFDVIGNLTALETINLSYNKFTSIPASIGNLTNLQTLSLSNNKLTVLPKALENLLSLTSVDVSYNQISDTQALLNTNIYLPLGYQTLSLPEFVYKGDDVLLTNLPNITRYNRANNDFSAINTFR
ncbi:leucine-rich repeat domain-containing protein, partial [Flavobacterium myungsuense]